MNNQSIELATYCGLYCGACDIYQKRIGQHGGELKRILDAYKFDEFAHLVPGLEDYKTFDKTLGTIVTFFGQCPNCQNGGGDPECKIRKCAKEKEYRSCVDCPSIPCDKFDLILGSNPRLRDDLKDIKEVGLDKWCQDQQVKVDKGFRYSD